MTNAPLFIFLEATDFQGYPAGGQSTFAERMVRAFPGEIALAGIRCDSGPVGKWTTTTIAGIEYPFFAVRHETRNSAKPLVPTRIRNLIDYRRALPKILASGTRNLFVQAPEIILALSRLDNLSVCYRYPGVQPPLDRSRYRAPASVGRAFESLVARILKNADVLLATADKSEIDSYGSRQSRYISRERLTWFPTRYDEKLFYPRNKRQAREKLGLDIDRPIFVSTGRINRRKGWDLLLDAFAIVVNHFPTSQLIFVGDGEDRQPLESKAGQLMQRGNVVVTGHMPQEQVAIYDAASDVFVNASHFEGWPNSIVEALASGRAVVSTDVSGARQMINDGVNGRLVTSRSPTALAQALIDAFNMGDVSEMATSAVSKYGISTLRSELADLWPSIR